MDEVVCGTKGSFRKINFLRSSSDDSGDGDPKRKGLGVRIVLVNVEDVSGGSKIDVTLAVDRMESTAAEVSEASMSS